MIKDILLALISDILRLLQKNHSFFELSLDQREAILKESNFPSQFSAYLSATSGKQFIEDIKDIILYLKGKSSFTEGNNLLKMFTEYIIKDTAHFLDSKTLPKDQSSLFSETLAHCLSKMTYQEITTDIYSFLNKYGKTPYIIIQSPIPISSETKRKIRENFLEKHHFTFPIFQVNKTIIGGMRLFVDGEVIDNSWMSKIQRLANIN